MRRVLLLAAAAVLPGQDQVMLQNDSGQSNGLIVWGQFSSGELSKEFANQPATADVGNVDLALLKANELVAFTADRAPAYKAFPWSPGPDQAQASYPNVVNLRVKVWVLCFDAACSDGPLPDTVRDDLLVKLASANALFTAQTAGVRFNLNDPSQIISDQTGNTTKKNQYKDFTGCGLSGLVKNLLDKQAMNFYLVRSVDNEFSRGNTCWRANIAVLGHLAGPGLIAHETGHNHWLQHAEYFPELSALGTKNIMHSLSTERTYLSEGEVYRMHFETQSVLNRTTGSSTPPAPRLEKRACSASNALKPCPGIGTRLWPDP
jgi:hypothetical protein